MSSRATLAILLGPAVAVSLACAGSAHSQVPPATGSRSATITTGSGPTISSTSALRGATATWPTFGHDAARSGVSPAQASFRAVSRRWTSARVDGSVYGQPLVVGSWVIVATEGDTVYGLSSTTGEVKWMAHLGAPMSASDLPCGNIDPSGITGTPVVDIASSTVWVVAFVQPGHPDLVAVDLATGAVKARRTVDPPGSNPKEEQQRGALSLVGGSVYVPYGGLFGDCGHYHGSSSALASTDRASCRAGRSRRRVKAASGRPVARPLTRPDISSSRRETAHRRRPSTTATPSFASAPDLVLQDWFAPTDSPSLNAQDADLGSTTPALVGDQQQLVFQIGKSGDGFLLHAANLGHQAAPAAMAHVCGSVLGATAYANPLLYVPCGDGMRALRIGPGDGFTAVWIGPGGHPGPPIVAGGVVWYLDTGSGELVGLDAQSGSSRFTTPVGAVSHFACPAAGDGQVIVAAGGTVQAYAFA